MAIAESRSLGVNARARSAPSTKVPWRPTLRTNKDCVLAGITPPAVNSVRPGSVCKAGMYTAGSSESALSAAIWAIGPNPIGGMVASCREVADDDGGVDCGDGMIPWRRSTVPPHANIIVADGVSSSRKSAAHMMVSCAPDNLPPGIIIGAIPRPRTPSRITLSASRDVTSKEAILFRTRPAIAATARRSLRLWGSYKSSGGTKRRLVSSTAVRTAATESAVF
mmetsp:Transcript_63709/g.109414  ORF Transcript_63709/g.109414 Transcript_63709/m.109414 type:complete len:223 (+) Transcript_63709:261-929(+)